MNELELKASIQNSPKSIGATSGALMLMALLLVVHRGYHADANGIVLWKGLLAGSFLAMLTNGDGRVSNRSPRKMILLAAARECRRYLRGRRPCTLWRKSSGLSAAKGSITSHWR